MIKNKETGESNLQIGWTKGSIPFQTFTDKLIDPKTSLKWTKRDINKPEKLLLLAIVQTLLGEKQSIEDFVGSKEGISNHKVKILESEVFKKITSQFKACFEQELEFNPSSGVIGAVASQEIIKVITKKDSPQHGLFLYDGTA